MSRMTWIFPAVVWLTVGCVNVARRNNDQVGHTCDYARPKTLLRWTSATDNPKSNDSNNASGDAAENAADPPAPDEIATDRPTFTPSSRAVGQGRVQLESGYTVTWSRANAITPVMHSYPEAELRIGMFANWFELRITQNLLSALSPIRSDTGAADLLLGTRFWLTENYRFLPESSLIIQTTVPSGAEAFTSHKMLPGMLLVYSWTLVPDRVTLGGSSQANAAVDDNRHSYLRLAQSLVLGYALTKKLGLFTECYALFPYGETSTVPPQYNFDSGFTYKITSNMQLDLRAGIGVNRNATDYFAGGGFAFRY